MNPLVNGIYQRVSAMCLDEVAVLNGKLYRMSFTKHTLSAAGIYSTLHFHTPALPCLTYYSYAVVDRVGEDAEITLIEGGAYVGGTATYDWNVNRLFKNQLSGLTNLKTGVSNVAPLTTITGGIVAPPRYLAGVAQGAYRATDSGEVGGFIILEPDQDYTTKITSLTGSLSLGILLSLAIF